MSIWDLFAKTTSLEKGPSSGYYNSWQERKMSVNCSCLGDFQANLEGGQLPNSDP